MNHLIKIAIFIIMLFFEGTAGKIELAIGFAIAFGITKLFEKKISERIIAVNGWEEFSEILLDKYWTKEKSKNIIKAIAQGIFKGTKERIKEDFEIKKEKWITIVDVSLFILFLIITWK